jgi:hypothetical protein
MTELKVIEAVGLGYLIYSIVLLGTKVSNIVEHWIKHEELNININLLCAKCFTFWIVLLGTQDLMIAAIASLTAYLLDSFVVTKL